MNFTKQCAIWIQEGRKLRSRKRRKEIYQQHCAACEWLQPGDREGKGTCAKCNMVVASIGSINKLAFADEVCPIGRFAEDLPSSEIHSAIAELPAETRILLGDRVKQLTDALGIPACGGCNRRREWLNKADAYIRQMWS